jgi:hypothetical protein
MRSTQIVRYVMQRAGKSSVFTNLYSTCRTVKCYASKDAVSDATLISEINAELAKWGIEGAKARVNTPSKSQSWGARSSIIVRLPL